MGPASDRPGTRAHHIGPSGTVSVPERANSVRPQSLGGSRDRFGSSAREESTARATTRPERAPPASSTPIRLPGYVDRQVWDAQVSARLMIIETISFLASA